METVIIVIWFYFVLPTLGRTITYKGLHIFVATIQLKEDDKNSTNSQTERNVENKNCRATNNEWSLDGGTEADVMSGVGRGHNHQSG